MFKDIQNFTTTITEADALKAAIKNILMTPRGSVPGKPDFGSDVYKAVFSQIDPLLISVLKNYVREALNEFEGRINITDVTIKSVPEYNKVIITVQFSYKSSNGINNTSTAVAFNV